MIETSSVISLLCGIPVNGDGATEKSRELILALLRGSADPFARSTFHPGHITCTGLVLAPHRPAVLLVHHKRLNRWLLPGGHVEPGDLEIWDAARREVVEETGTILAPNNSPMLVGMDVHAIPANGREPLHLHHDLVFRFQAQSEEFELSSEVREIAWCPASDFERYHLPDNIRRSFRRSMEV